MSKMTQFYAPSSASRRSATLMTPELRKLMPSIADHTVGNHLGRSSALGHAKTYYNPARHQLYSRYSTNEWENSNQSNYSLSEQERNLAERLRGDAWRLVKTTDHRTRNRQASNTRKLGERVCDIGFWKNELVTESREMDSEIENLQEHTRVLEKACYATNNPLTIAEECLLQREKRQGIDMVHDNVERHLSKEVDTIKRCQQKMKRLIEKAHIQLKMNAAVQQACEKDCNDKYHAQHLDDRMHALRNSSASLAYHPGIENVDNTISVPNTWVKFTRENIGRSQKEREASEKLRGEIDCLIRGCANEMWSQFSNVNNAFQDRIQQTTEAKNKLQAHLGKTMNEIADMDRAIGQLKAAIMSKEGPMKVAQTRLDERTRRIKVELCNDTVMKGLQKEVAEIRGSVRMLKEKLRQAENALVRLCKIRAKLESDIAVKENSLTIDSKYCMGIRKNMAMDRNAGPIFQMPLMY